MLSSPVRPLATAEASVRCCFPDVPEAVSDGRFQEDAPVRARAALGSAFADRAAAAHIANSPMVTTDRLILPLFSDGEFLGAQNAARRSAELKAGWRRTSLES